MEAFILPFLSLLLLGFGLYLSWAVSTGKMDRRPIDNRSFVKSSNWFTTDKFLFGRNCQHPDACVWVFFDSIYLCFPTHSYTFSSILDFVPLFGFDQTITVTSGYWVTFYTYHTYFKNYTCYCLHSLIWSIHRPGLMIVILRWPLYAGGYRSARKLSYIFC